ncbi:uncharacterized protein LOC123656463 [Melitaea cinxia]|uniref:uncharacterized protein LOC123656463 n=1 Tax=Melitaea cinxia TaxID=113334 RepID=UPI001E26EF03|nr:uncharacterized protein LOC123656463 [Melitaea cinxia]
MPLKKHPSVLGESYQKAKYRFLSLEHASERAYGACLYIRSVHKSGLVTVHLLTSKNRVAPIKPTTMPRLELCGALLAARLCAKILKPPALKPGSMLRTNATPRARCAARDGGTAPPSHRREDIGGLTYDTSATL